jgi:polyribonucleotide nucleotidyltransferase
MIGLVIGPGGKNIKKIEEETGVTGGYRAGDPMAAQS